MANVKRAMQGLMAVALATTVLSPLWAQPVVAFTPSPLSTKESRFQVQAVAGVHEILFYGYIGQWKDWDGNVVGVSKESFMAELDKIPPDARVLARFDTDGGDLATAFLIHNRLKEFGDRLTVQNDGMCASSGTVIFCAAKAENRKAKRASIFMIHPCATMAYGPVAEMEAVIAQLKAFAQPMMGIYAAANPANAQKIPAWVSATTWFAGEAQKDAGWVSEIIDDGSAPITACFRRAVYANTPQELIMTTTPATPAAAPAAAPALAPAVTPAVTASAAPSAEPTVAELKAEIAALAASITALATPPAPAPAAAPAAEPKVEAKVDPKSPVVLALRSIAARNGGAEDFDDAIKGGFDLAQLQGLATGVAARTPATSSVLAMGGDKPAASKLCNAADIYAERRKASASKKV